MNTADGLLLEKFAQAKKNTWFSHLSAAEQELLEKHFFTYRLTFQELRKLTEAARDLGMWRGRDFTALWNDAEKAAARISDAAGRKKELLKYFDRTLESLRRDPKEYDAAAPLPNPARAPLRLEIKDSDKKVYGECPVASPETVCCNLKTIDAVENCAFGCSYCTIQTFYGDKAVFDPRFKEKLEAISLAPGRFYHIGTGQSSDSLVWGNREGILDALCAFAAARPEILLEFKTKSDNITYFQNNTVPANVVCSWSLNTEAVVNNEEHFTATLERRLKAARAAADRGIKVAFHFHPMVYYAGWETDYPALARRVLEDFRAEEVLFISFGSVTFIKPVMKEIRERGDATRILQMELVPAEKNKWSYPEAVKVGQFQAMFEAFQPWQEKVFFYLCMEPARIWDQVFGWHYPSNEEFEMDFGRKTMAKVNTANARNAD